MSYPTNFYTAIEARQQAALRGAVITELHLVESGVSAAIEAGALEATIGPASSPAVVTGLTNSSTAYEAYTDPAQYDTDAHRVTRLQMDAVIGHFSRLGYTVTRERHLETSTFNWIIRW